MLLYITRGFQVPKYLEVEEPLSEDQPTVQSTIQTEDVPQILRGASLMACHALGQSHLQCIGSSPNMSTCSDL